jgi:Aldehyde dehydrogenase family
VSANDSEYGLGATVWSPDHDHSVAVAARIHSGTVGINYYLPDITASYGGIKNSGIGREQGFCAGRIVIGLDGRDQADGNSVIAAPHNAPGFTRFGWSRSIAS